MKKTILLSVILFFIAGAFSLYLNKYDISADAGKNPTVLIDREGYLPGEEKKCFFLRDAADKNESDVFYVVDKKTRKTVFTGTMTSSSEGNVCMGRFSDVKTEGEYYIEAPFIGRSYVFRIGKDVSGIKQKIIFDNMKDPGRDGTIYDTAKKLLWLCRIEESYGADSEIKDFQSELAERLVNGEATVSYNDITDAKDDITFRLAAEVSYYGLLNKRGQEEKAAEYLKDAQRLYGEISDITSRRESMENDRLMFLAAASFYKETGEEKYHEKILELYEKMKDEGAIKTDDDTYLSGALMYLSTVYDTDIDICGEMMEGILSLARAYCDNTYGSEFYIIGRDKDLNDMADMLYITCVIEQTVISREYVDIMSDTMHYYFGANKTGSSLSGREYGGNMGAFLYVIKEIEEREAGQ